MRTVTLLLITTSSALVGSAPPFQFAGLLHELSPLAPDHEMVAALLPTVPSRNHTPTSDDARCSLPQMEAYGVTLLGGRRKSASCLLFCDTGLNASPFAALPP